MASRQSAASMQRGDRAAEPAKAGIDCVFLTCLDDDFELFAGLLRVSGIRLHHAATVEQADFLLTVTDATVLLSDTLFLDGTWTIAASMLASFHPGVSLLVTVEDRDRESPEAIRRAASDLILRPMRLSRLREAVQTAHQAAQKRP